MFGQYAKHVLGSDGGLEATATPDPGLLTVIIGETTEVCS